MMGPELRICLVLFTFILDQLGFNFMLGSSASLVYDDTKGCTCLLACACAMR